MYQWRKNLIKFSATYAFNAFINNKKQNPHLSERVEKILLRKTLINTNIDRPVVNIDVVLNNNTKKKGNNSIIKS